MIDLDKFYAKRHYSKTEALKYHRETITKLRKKKKK